MKTHHFVLSLTLVTLITLVLILSLADQPSANADPRVAPGVLSELQETGRVDALILLSAQPDFSSAYDFSSKQERGQWVYDTLRIAAEDSQSDLITELNRSGIAYQRFWLVNAVRAEMDAATLERILRLESVEKVLDNSPVLSAQPLPIEGIDAASTTNTTWGVNRVDAPWAWEQGYTGEGVVVAGQDTGYAWEHEALKTAYRGYDVATDTANHDYNWHDAIHEDLPPTNGNPCGFDSPVPCDDHGHGTHTMGTMVGNNLDPADPSWPSGAGEAIGVAPGADWISCRNMEKGVGRPSTYIECYEWFVAPYPLGGNPMVEGDPAKAPDVMNNSWSCITSEGCTADILDVIEPAVNAADAAGIVVVSSAGNEGSSCGSVQSPSAIYPRTFAVGATSSADALASFSSRGPVLYKGEMLTKPDVSAPGVSVRSSFPPNRYGNSSGTSMASPHTAAVIALLLDAEPDLRGDTDMIKAIVQQTAIPVVDFGCGGDSDGSPNNSFGWGIVNARQAIESLSQSATLSGQVVDEQDQALAGALVQVHDKQGQFVGQTIADETGHYELELAWGSYQVEASLDGYTTTSVEPVYLVGGQTTDQDMVLAGSTASSIFQTPSSLPLVYGDTVAVEVNLLSTMSEDINDSTAIVWLDDEVTYVDNSAYNATPLTAMQAADLLVRMGQEVPAVADGSDGGVEVVGVLWEGILASSDSVDFGFTAIVSSTTGSIVHAVNVFDGYMPIGTFASDTLEIAEIAVVELPLLADTWVNSGGGSEAVNYDDYAALVARTTGLDNVLLTFDRSALPEGANLISAELMVNVTLESGAFGKKLAVLNTEGFDSAIVTFETAPAIYNPGESVAATAGMMTLDVIGNVEAWDAVNAQTSDDHHVDRLAISASGPFGRISMDSLETWQAKPPMLVVRYFVE